MSKIRNLVGEKFGLLTVVAHAGTEKSSGGVIFQMWKCECDCGGERVSRSNNLVSGRNKSCGCRSHGYKKHGMHDHPLRTTRSSIIQRCENPKNPNYKSYGARGIKICDEWRRSLPAFIEHMVSIGWEEGCGLSVDRIDNDGNYEPGNIRLATATTQARNNRRNRLVKYKGQVKTLAEWSEVAGIPYERLRYRLSHGWSVESALFQPCAA